MSDPINNATTADIEREIDNWLHARQTNRSELTQELVSAHPALHSLIGRWLVAKGVDHTKAHASSPHVRANAFRAGDRYVKTMMPDANPFDNIKPLAPRKPTRRGGGIDLGDDIKELLDDKPVMDELDKALAEIKDPDDEPETKTLPGPLLTPPAPQHIFDPVQVARIVAPQLARLSDALRKEIANEATNVRGDLDRGIERRWTEAERHFQTRTQGLIDGMRGEIFKYIDENTPRKIEIVEKGTVVRTLDAEPRHKSFDEGLKWLMAGQHLYIVGGAGTGKTHLFEQWGKALNKKVWLVGQALSKYDISGYKGPTGEYFGTVVRDALEQGGLLCIDEVDMWAAAALGFLNAPLANGWCAFPDKTIEVHPDFQCILAANTFGRGATQQYNGRNPLDAASLDRFAYIEVDYDYDLELQIHGDNPWTRYVQRVRDAIQSLKLQHVVSMRATKRVHDGLRVGLEPEKVLFSALWRGLAPDTISKIKQIAGEPPTRVVEVPLDNEPDFDEFRDFVDSNQMVQAIKAFRNQFPGIRLVTAKNIAEGYRNGLYDLNELHEIATHRMAQDRLELNA